MGDGINNIILLYIIGFDIGAQLDGRSAVLLQNHCFIQYLREVLPEDQIPLIQEMLGYFRGEMPLSEARERLCIATRQYAKRQVTWFGAKDYIETVELRPDLPDPTEALLRRIREWIDK